MDTVNILKAEGFKFPALKESDAMFSADTAPEWADGEVCHRMPARKLVSDQQIHILLQYMEANREFAVGRLPNSGPLEKQRVAKQWEELATTLNSVGVGATKAGGKWRDYNAPMPHASASPVRDVSSLPTQDPLVPHKANTMQEKPAAAPALPPAPSSSRPCHVTVSIEEFPDVVLPAHLPMDAPVPMPAADATPAPEPASAPVPSPAPAIPTARRPRTTAQSGVPQWALELEERRIAAQEHQARATEQIAQMLEVVIGHLVRIEALMEAEHRRH